MSKAQRSKLFSRYKKECEDFMHDLSNSSEENKEPSCYLFFPEPDRNFYAKLQPWEGIYNPPVEPELKLSMEKFIQGVISKNKHVVLFFVGDTFVSACIKDLKKVGSKKRGFKKIGTLSAPLM